MILKTKITDERKAWNSALQNWNGPSIPYIIIPKSKEELEQLGEVGTALREELAFMNIENFQTYANLENIIEAFPENPQRGLEAVTEHVVGHRFCPYDKVTMIILKHKAKKALEKKKLKIDLETASQTVLNLHLDTIVNTFRVGNSSRDIPWAYQELTKTKSDSSFWRVYAKSMEYLWGEQILQEKTVLTEKESKSARSLAQLFQGNFFHISQWTRTISEYASIIADFLDDIPRKPEKGKNTKDQGKPDTGFDDMSKNIPTNLNEQTKRELIKRLAEIGNDGLPTNSTGLEDFKEIMAGYEKGDEKKACIRFYDMLSDSYTVTFTKQPFGKSRQRPFRPIQWHPSMSPETLDVPSSLATGGRLIPGETTIAWKYRKRTKDSLEEIIPFLDLYIDSSGSVPDPTRVISLLTLAGFVVAKKAQKKTDIRATVFSGKGQYKTTGPTRDLEAIFDTLVTYYNGGTIFPTEKLLDTPYPKQVLIITDTFICNKEETAEKIRELSSKHKGNKITIYATGPVVYSSYLEQAGAEVIHDTSTRIFKNIIGKAQEVYK